MAVYRCKMCGGELAFEPGSTIAVCEYCGTRQTVSSAGDEKRINLFNRANRLRMNSEFDRAATIYEQIIAEFPEDAEAYWGLCLCNYGIEYVDDPATARKIPTCHRASFDLLRDDEIYKQALKHADASAGSLYQEEAKEIDRIMGEILSISKNERPYDVFICYKETDDNGGRTVDSVAAQDIYDALTERGYKVFFSRITLEDKLGQQYEPYIFAALNSAKVMLAVGTDYENFNSVWVKNEWSRFLRLMAKDKNKVLIPCYKDMDPYDLPVEFKGLQAQNLSKLGYMQDLLRGIDKISGKTHISGDHTAQNDSSVELLHKRANDYLKKADWATARAIYNSILDLNEEDKDARLGVLLADLKIKSLDDLSSLDRPFGDLSSYKKAIQYSDSETGSILEKRNLELESQRQKKRKKIIISSVALVSAIAVLIGGYAAVKDLIDRRMREKALLEEQQAIQAEAEAKLEVAYNEAISLFEEKRYVEAIEAFTELETYRDSEEQIEKCLDGMIGEAQSLLNDGKYFDAVNAFTEMENYLDTDEYIAQYWETMYKNALALLENKKYGSAYELFMQLGDYKDSESQAELSLKQELKNAVVGTSVYFGRYEQDNDLSNGKETIEWVVIKQDKGRLLLLSADILDASIAVKSVTTQTKHGTTTSRPDDWIWEYSPLRGKCNSIYSSAFNAYEKSVVLSVNNTDTYRNDYSPSASKEYASHPTIKPTQDTVFLLSYSEVEALVQGHDYMKCSSSKYAKEKGVSSVWWLRTPCGNKAYEYFVVSINDVKTKGTNLSSSVIDLAGIRPAVWVDIGE